MNNAMKVFDELYNEFIEEKEQLEAQLSKNENDIVEISMYLEKVVNPDYNDFLVFSPRSNDVINSDEIASKKDQIELLKSKNDDLLSSIGIVKKRILLLDELRPYVSRET